MGAWAGVLASLARISTAVLLLVRARARGERPLNALIASLDQLLNQAVCADFSLRRKAEVWALGSLGCFSVPNATAGQGSDRACGRACGGGGRACP